MIEHLYLNNFTCFDDSVFDFCKGINVLIGRNGTGKTHILKCLAASMKANALFNQSTSKTKDKFGDLLSEKLIGYFKPDTLGHLVNKYGSGATSVKVKLTAGDIAYNFGERASLVKTDNNVYIEQPHFIYIPPREMFSLFEGFISLYERREISFDETYLDLAKAMDISPLKNEALKEAKDILAPILAKWNIDVMRKGNRFYVLDDSQEYEAHLVAEGLRKVATILYLCINGELRPGSILFWDEPESNMNPNLISIIVDLLMELARKHGVQIFLSTHDYLLSHKLSMMAEYAAETSPAMRFFSLYKNGHQVEAEVADQLVNIAHNPILEEYSAFYDLENEYIKRHNERI
ncbi:ATP-binding protein [Bacteroides sp. GM023]|uniref:ATP-binding protein n=1 Tax=Bacteroides sp. GM023 TaxID=2723058 RepID=UPI00168B368E|nr:ATP-binding protein [Bacteroides sp. GM023]MBD3589519.1 AAA family ATPase [Bacteroides sp. GM023]